MTRTTLLLLLGGLLLMGGVWFLGGSPRPDGSDRPWLRRTRRGWTLGFEPHHGTALRGRAFVRPGETSFTVRIRLRHLEADRRYNVHLHRGNCREGGAGGLGLSTVRADSTGVGTARTRVSYGALNPTFDHLIMVHAPNGHHVMCADVPALARMRSFRARGDAGGVPPEANPGGSTSRRRSDGG